MKILSKFLRGVAVAAAYAAISASPAHALTFDNGDYSFYSLNPAPNGSGLGNYNVILFENAVGGSGNAGGTVNVDNSNTLLPTGNTSGSGTLYWMVSVADLQAFYLQQFPNTTINNIVLFVDINETGSGSNPITVSNLTIYQNATTSPNLNPNPNNDLTSAQQNSITSFTDGTLLKQLSNVSASLDQQQTGQGVDDWAIFTFIDPFALLPTDTLLFKIEFNDLSAGGETLSINGALTACDIDPNGCPTTGTTTTGGTSGSTTSGTSTGESSGTTTTTTTGESSGSTTGTTTSDPTTGTTTSDPTTGTTTSDPTTGDSTGATTSIPTTGTSSTGTDTTGVTTSSSSGESSGTTRDIPEPSTFLLLGSGLVALSRLAKRKRD